MSTHKVKGYLSAKFRGWTHRDDKSRSTKPTSGPNHSPTPSILNAVPAPVSANKKSADLALKNAIDIYATKLSEDDKIAFQSAGNIMEKIQTMDEDNAQTSLLRSFGARIGKILQFIQQFVNSVAICIQHNPEISSLVLGGFNCVLLLVLGYIEFFESLTTMMERIGEHLPYLSKYGSRMFENSPDVQNALVKAYCDLLDFFVAVRGVFLDKEGTYLRSAKLFLKLAWEPFESRFRPIQDRFLEHTIIVVRSARVQNLITKFEKEQQENLARIIEKRRKVLEWLWPSSSIDYEGVHRKNFKKHFKNTGQWFLDDPRFTTWKGTASSSLLWCHGMPGSGKTILASLVVQKLLTEYEVSDDTGIAFVYCNYREPQEATTYIKVLIKQLVSRRRNELPVELEELYNKHYNNSTNPTYTDLEDILRRISKLFEKVFLVLDALDECLADQKQELFEVLRGIVSPTGADNGNVKLFITSRREKDIEYAFKGFPIITIEARKISGDIKAYVTAQLDQRLPHGAARLPDDVGALKRTILTALVDQAGGMFLWVEFQLQHILSLTSYHDIESALKSLPEDMEETYERIIRRIQARSESQRNLARRVLMWIAYADRSLSLEELLCAVTLEDGTKSAKQLQSMVPKVETLFEVCENLIFNDSTGCRRGKEFIDGQVRFVHFSVQEFLRNSDKHPITTTLNIRPTSAHDEIARMCITFILFCRWENGCKHCYDHFFYYAHTWMSHVRKLALADISPDLMLLIHDIFKFNPFLEEISEEYYRLSRASSWDHQHAKGTKFSPPTTALVLDLPLVSNHLAKEVPDQLHYPDDLYAMSYAAKINSWEAIEQLCSQGFGVNSLDTLGNAPLYYAASTYPANKKIVQFLLDRGADVNAYGGDGKSTLQAAAATINNKEVVEMLLDKGADVNAQGGKYGNALQAAARHGNEKIVKILLDKGADVNAQGAQDGDPLSGGEYGNALQAAAWRGTEEIVKLLLDRGADVNAQGGQCGNALLAAAARGKKKVAEILLDRGADMSTQEGGYGNALQAAAYSGEKEVVEMLLDKGADVNARGGYHGTALQAAAINLGNKKIIEMLLDKGADVNAQGGGKYGNALQAAVQNGNEEVVEMLLDKGADVNAQGGDQYGSVLKAAKTERIRKLLLDRGATGE